MRRQRSVQTCLLAVFEISTFFGVLHDAQHWKDIHPGATTGTRRGRSSRGGTGSSNSRGRAPENSAQSIAKNWVLAVFCPRGVAWSLASARAITTVFRVCRCCCKLFIYENIDDFHVFSGMCLFPKENQQPIWGLTVFLRKSNNWT